MSPPKNPPPPSPRKTCLSPRGDERDEWETRKNRDMPREGLYTHGCVWRGSWSHDVDRSYAAAVDLLFLECACYRGTAGEMACLEGERSARERASASDPQGDVGVLALRENERLANPEEHGRVEDAKRPEGFCYSIENTLSGWSLSPRTKEPHNESCRGWGKRAVASRRYELSNMARSSLARFQRASASTKTDRIRFSVRRSCAAVSLHCDDAS